MTKSIKEEFDMKKTKRIYALSLAVVSAAALSLTAMASTNDTEDTEEAETAEEDTEFTADPEFAEYLGEIKTCQYFTEDPVDEEDIEIILNAGINAQSGMNRQDWHFTAVTSLDIMEEIGDDMNTPRTTGTDQLSRAMIADAPLVIIISCGEDEDYDAGLATQAMNSAALALGYGTKIISSPTSVLNGENQDYYRELLEIPEDMETVGMLLVGTPLDTSDMDPDTITGATSRKDFDEITTILQ